MQSSVDNIVHVFELKIFFQKLKSLLQNSVIEPMKNGTYKNPRFFDASKSKIVLQITKSQIQNNIFRTIFISALFQSIDFKAVTPCTICMEELLSTTLYLLSTSR